VLEPILEEPLLHVQQGLQDQLQQDLQDLVDLMQIDHHVHQDLALPDPLDPLDQAAAQDHQAQEEAQAHQEEAHQEGAAEEVVADNL